MLNLKIAVDGNITFIYNDALASLIDEGQGKVARASHVEPCPGGWTADLSPVSGPILGPFKLRAEALDAEVSWLKDNVIG